MPQADLQVTPFAAENAKPPKRMSNKAVGFDFYAEEIIRETKTDIWYRTGYGVNIPDDCFGDLRARSSVSGTGLFLANGAGVIDPDYQGEVQFRFYKARTFDLDLYEPGDRIGQLIVVPAATRRFTGVEVVEDFNETTERGEDGFGSTNK